MKILGIGIDVTKISRFDHILAQNYHQRFLVKVLHTK